MAVEAQIVVMGEIEVFPAFYLRKMAPHALMHLEEGITDAKTPGSTGQHTQGDKGRVLFKIYRRCSPGTQSLILHRCLRVRAFALEYAADDVETAHATPSASLA